MELVEGDRDMGDARPIGLSTLALWIAVDNPLVSAFVHTAVHIPWASLSGPLAWVQEQGLPRLQVGTLEREEGGHFCDSVFRARTRCDEQEPCWSQAVSGETQESSGIANGPGQDHVGLDWRAPILHATAHDLHIVEGQLAGCLAEEIGTPAAALDEGDCGRGESDGEGYSRESGTGPHVDDIVVRHGPHGRMQRQCSNDVALRKMGKVLE